MKIKISHLCVVPLLLSLMLFILAGYLLLKGFIVFDAYELLVTHNKITSLEILELTKAVWEAWLAHMLGSATILFVFYMVMKKFIKGEGHIDL